MADGINEGDGSTGFGFGRVGRGIGASMTRCELADGTNEGGGSTELGFGNVGRETGVGIIDPVEGGSLWPEPCPKLGSVGVVPEG